MPLCVHRAAPGLRTLEWTFSYNVPESAPVVDRNEVGALLVAVGLGAAAEHALVSLLALNGLRVSEALGADIEALGLERGHRTLTVLRKSGKVVTVPWHRAHDGRNSVIR